MARRCLEGAERCQWRQVLGHRELLALLTLSVKRLRLEARQRHTTFEAEGE
jgi:hypothetical protein